MDMPYVEFETTMGNIVIELNIDKAPKTVENFISYVNEGHYNGTIFHRVIDGFMIQGGGMDANMKEKKHPRTDSKRSEQRLGERNRHDCYGSHVRPTFCNCTIFYQCQRQQLFELLKPNATRLGLCGVR